MVASHNLLSYGLLQRDQRGAKQDYSGTVDNLIIDRMVCQDGQRGHRNLSMAWIDVSKAYDSVDHRWLMEMLEHHRLPEWFGSFIGKISQIGTQGSSRKRSRVARVQRSTISSKICHLCPALFTLCLNPIAWKVRGTSGYKLSKPISCKVTHCYTLTTI